MRVQDYFVESIRRGAQEAFNYAKAVPADKLDWSPMEGGRSVLDICRELAMTPTWAHDTIEGVEMDWSPEAQAALKQVQSEWKTVEDCEAQFNERAKKMEELFKNMPDERLSQTKWLPYGGGRDFTMVEMMEYPKWNLDYHTGQIAYIQTLYGDKEMH